jgi:DNA-binding NtrC family response regulator
MKNILVVDDESDIRDSIKMILEKKGYNVITSCDGDDCLKKLNYSKIDLLILDIMMPGKPVSEIVENIEDIKIAFISAIQISDIEKKELSTHDNIVDFIQKPFDTIELADKVKKILGE